MKREQLIPLLPEVKAIIQAAYPDVVIHGRLRQSSEDKHVVLLFDSEEKANSTDKVNDALVAFFEGSDDKWRAFYYGIHDFGERDGKPYAEYGMIPLEIELDDLVELAGRLSDHLLGVT